MSAVVSALFVDPKGPYWSDPRCECWDEAKDARNYRGPLPVVAHPPCGRWCRLAKLVEARYPRLRVGDDGGCFARALEIVREFCGVLEHPAWSLAWGAHGLLTPNVGGWTRCEFEESWDNQERKGYVCEVNQSAYGHAATKATWLYYVGTVPPAPMNWSRVKGTKVVGHCTRRGDGTIWRRNADRMSSGTHLTPKAFADALIELAANCGGARAQEKASEK